MSNAKAGPCTTVSKGGIGESGASTILIHPVSAPIAKMMVLRTTQTSLCGNTGAIGVLVVNGDPVAHGNITAAGSSIQAEVQHGDTVVAIVHTVPLFNEIVCIRLGELHIELQECDLVT